MFGRGFNSLRLHPLNYFVSWCNGSTTDSGPVCQGSNPCETTLAAKHNCNINLCRAVFRESKVRLSRGVMVAQQVLVLFDKVRVLAGQLIFAIIPCLLYSFF